MKKLIMLLLCFTFTAASGITAYAGNGWGLSFPVEGEQPRGNETAEYLAQFDAFFIGSPNDMVMYLTFDAGFENSYTAEILDILQTHNAPAAFFLVGTYIKNNPDIVQRMADEGHIVANHTMSHPDMSAISCRETFLNELTQVEEFYEQITGQEMPKLYRPPKGIYSEDNLQMAQELGYKTIFWSLTYKDWGDDQPSKEEAFSKLIPRSHPGAVVLLHNTSSTNALILDELLTKYAEMGFRFESLNHLTGESFRH